VKHLVEECGVDVNQPKEEISFYLVYQSSNYDQLFLPPLCHAIVNGLEDVSIYLIDHGANVKEFLRYSSPRNYTPLPLACEVNTPVNHDNHIALRRGSFL
jgi:hypothetical protein